MPARRIIVVGAGVAGARAAEAIRSRFDAEVVLLGREVEAPYQRPALSKEVLRGEALPEEELRLLPSSSFGDDGLVLRTGAKAVGLHPRDQSLELDGGERLEWHRLVLATGSRPRTLDVPGAHLTGVTTLRTLAEATRLAAALTSGVRVVGAGLLGLEVAGAARARGAEVVVVERGVDVLRRVLGPLVAPTLTRWVEGRGLPLRRASTVKQFHGVTRVTGVELTSGEVLPAEVVVLALGAVPETAWLEASGLVLRDGAVEVDELGQTSLPGVFATGEVASAWNPTLGRFARVEHHGWAWSDGARVGLNVMGERVPLSGWPGGGTEVLGRRLQFAGDFTGLDEARFVGDVGAESFTAALAREGQVRGIVGFGAPRAFSALRHFLGASLSTVPTSVSTTTTEQLSKTIAQAGSGVKAPAT